MSGKKSPPKKNILLPSLSANKTAYYFYETSERTHEFSRPKICSPISLERFQSNIIRRRSRQRRVYLELWLKEVAFFQSPFEWNWPQRLINKEQRRLAPCARFKRPPCPRCLTSASNFPSMHSVSLITSLSSELTSFRQNERGVRYARALFLSDRLSKFCALSVVVFTKGGQKSGCLPACLFSRTSSC